MSSNTAAASARGLVAPVAGEEDAPVVAPARHFGGVVPEHETPKMLRTAVFRLAWPSIV